MSICGHEPLHVLCEPSGWSLDLPPGSLTTSQLALGLILGWVAICVGVCPHESVPTAVHRNYMCPYPGVWTMMFIADGSFPIPIPMFFHAKGFEQLEWKDSYMVSKKCKRSDNKMSSLRLL